MYTMMVHFYTQLLCLEIKQQKAKQEDNLQTGLLTNTYSCDGQRISWQSDTFDFEVI